MNKKAIIQVFSALLIILSVGCLEDEAITIEDLTKRMQEIKKSVSTDTAIVISPDIKTNNLDGPVYRQPADNLSVTVSLDSEGSSVDSDWWVAANVSGTSTIDGWYYFNLSAFEFVFAGASHTDLLVTHQGALFNLPTFGILNMPVSVLPPGTYTFYFAVDTNRNGLLDLDQSFFDFVVVNINNDGKTTFNIPAVGVVKDVPVKAGQPKTISFVSNLPVSVGPFTDISIDLNAVLENVTVDLCSSAASQLKDDLTGAGDPPPAQVSVRISNDIDTVCNTGFLIGTYTVFVNSSNQPSSVSPSTSSAPQSTLSVVNTGSFAICTEITYPVDATISLGNVELDATTCDEAPADISGIWTGTFSCTNIGCLDEGGPVSLTITQNGNSAHYEDDEGASFDGTVCGNKFKFNGGKSTWTESGTFILNADGTASKTSSWRENDGSCHGDCVDDLHR